MSPGFNNIDPFYTTIRYTGEQFEIQQLVKSFDDAGMSYRIISKHIPITGVLLPMKGRNGAQFCIYIHDFYVIPKLIEKGEYNPSIAFLDKLTKDFIQNNLSYRFVSFKTDNSDEIVRSLENKIKSGAFGFSPSINGTTLPQN